MVIGFSPCCAREYRIDSQESFDALGSGVFLPGDTILFKRGAQFNGMFAPSGMGWQSQGG
jgi:hypothetical protein